MARSRRADAPHREDGEASSSAHPSSASLSRSPSQAQGCAADGAAAVSHKAREKTGRPSKYNAVTVEAICTAIQTGATFETAAAAAGIHRDTLIEWRRQFPDFSDRLKEAEAAGKVALLNVIRAAAPEHWQAAAWILERRHGDEFGRNKHEHTGEVTHKVIVEWRNDWRTLGHGGAVVEASDTEGAPDGEGDEGDA